MVHASVDKTTAPARMRLMHWMTAGMLVVVAAAAAGSAHAQGHGRSTEVGGVGPGMMMLNGPPEHIARAVDHLLDGLDATDAQRSQVRQIAQTAAVDLKAQHEASRSLHAKALQIFAAPVIDAAAAESVRQQMLAQHDQASKRMLLAMLDVGKVLTPEQRAKLGERMKQRQAAMQDRMHRTQGEHREHGEKPKP